MNSVTSPPATLSGVLKSSLIYYLDVLKVIWPIIIFFVLLKNMFVFILNHIQAESLILFFEALFCLLLLFLFSYLLAISNAVIQSNLIELRSLLMSTIKRFPHVLMVFGFTLMILAITFFLIRWVMVNIEILKSPDLSLFLFMLVGFLLLMEILYCFFAIPLIAVDNLKCHLALLKSSQFLRQDLKLVTVSYFSVILIVMLIAPGSLHAIWIYQHRLSLLFDLAVTLLFLPLSLNIIIFSMRAMQKKIVDLESSF